MFDACFQDSVVLNTYIDRDYQRMDVSIADIAPNHCPGHTYDLTPEVTGGYQPYSFIWSTGQTTSAIDVAPLETATYTLSVTDSCALDTIVRQVTVNVPDFKPLRILGQDTFHFPCPEGHLDITAYDYYGRGGSGSAADQSHYTFSWDNWLTTRRELQLTVRNDTLLLLQMTDTCHLDTALLNVVVDVYDGPAISASLNDTLHACIGETFVFGPNVTGGVMPYTYRWNDGTRDSSFVLKPEKAKATSKVTITDFCGVNTQEQTTVYATQPMAEFKMTNDSYEPRLFNFENFSEDAISYRWIFGDGAESNLEDPSHSYPDLKAWEVTLIATDTFGCDDQLTKPLEVPLNLFIPNAFTPDGDGKNEVWQPLGYGFKSLGFTIYNRWGNAIFTAPESSQSISGWDGELVPNGVYSYIIVVEPFMERKKEIRGQVQVLR